MVTNISFWSESIAFPLLTTLTLVPLAAMFAVLFSRSTVVAIARLCRNATQLIAELLSVVGL